MNYEKIIIIALITMLFLCVFIPLVQSKDTIIKKPKYIEIYNDYPNIYLEIVNNKQHYMIAKKIDKECINDIV